MTSISYLNAREESLHVLLISPISMMIFIVKIEWICLEKQSILFIFL